MAPSPQRTKSRFVRAQVELEGRGQRVLQSQDTVFLFLLGCSTIEKGRWDPNDICRERLAPTVDTGDTHSTARRAVRYGNY